jgi:MtrB/PioB family decaheme-associated outer membrane protein
MRSSRVTLLMVLVLVPLAAGAQTTSTAGGSPGTSQTAGGQQPPAPPSPPGLPSPAPPGTGQPGTPDSALGSAEWTGTFDVGLRGSSVEGDRGRYERYRDLGDGFFLQGVRISRDHDGWLMNFQSDHVGRRDQRYIADVIRPGKLKAFFMWDQIPMLLSRNTRTLFSGVGTGELTIADEIQLIGQDAATRPLLTDIFRQSGVQFLTDTRRHIAQGRFEYEATSELTFRGNVRHTDREGTIPFGGSFGHGSLVELPAPIQHRLSDVDAGAEFVRNPWLLRAGYTGSWFHNDATSVAFDNPFRAVDIPTASSRGRLSLAPSSSHISVNGLASVRLPYRSRATAYASIGVLKDAGDPLIPQTINAAVSPAPIERSFVEGEAGVSSVNLRFVSRPTRTADITLQYRTYEYDNRTPEFHLSQRVSFDNAPANLATPIHTEPFGVMRHTFDADVRYLPTARTSAGIGFTRVAEDRTHRIFETTTDNQIRLTFDALSQRVFSVRTKYEHAQRRGQGIEQGEEFLRSIGEQPGMRHFDIAARDRNRITVIGSVTPADYLIANLSIAVGKDDYIQSLFGLRDNTHRVYGAGTDIIATDRASFGLSYSFEEYDALSRSRQAGAATGATAGEFNDPARNWAADTSDRTHTVILSGDVNRIAEKVDVRLSYDFSRGRAHYRYITGPVPNRTLPEEVVLPTTLPTPTELPPTLSELQRGTVDAVYALTSQIGIGFSYWHERFRVRDFTLDIDANPDAVRGAALFIGYLYEPYTANTGWVRLVYRW